MANYTLFGTGTNMFDAFANAPSPVPSLADSILYWTSTEIGLQNPDGSKTFVSGTDFLFDPDAQYFVSGRITRLVHYTNGQYTDEINGLNLDAIELSTLPYVGNAFVFLQGDDVLDARARKGNAVLPVTLSGYDGNDTIYGGAGNDRLYGDRGNDQINGGGGSDHFFGGTGADILRGGAGNDVLQGDAGDQINFSGPTTVPGVPGNDQLLGSGGNDILFGGYGNDKLDGGAGTDTVVYEAALADLAITATSAGFTIKYLGDTDTLSTIERLATDFGTYSFDVTTQGWTRISATTGVELVNPAGVYTGTGSVDTLVAKQFDTTILMRGLGGNDTLDATFAASALILAGTGNDTVTVFNGRAYGEGGNDRLLAADPTARFGADDPNASRQPGSLLDGGAGNDLLLGNSGSDTLNGGAGTDSALYFSSFTGLKITKTASGFTVNASGATDTLNGVERIVADEGTYTFNSASQSWQLLSDKSATETLDPNARLTGTAGDDVLALSGTGKAVVYALAGNDQVTGAGLADLIFGGAGNDSISGDYSPGLGQFSSSNDRLYGGEGDDTISGGAGNDDLNGGAGIDTLFGNNGDDVLTGGTGADKFVMSFISGRFSNDRWGNDVITDFQLGTDKIDTTYRFELFPVTPVETLTLTADGWLLETSLGGSVLLQGITTPGLTLGDILI